MLKFAACRRKPPLRVGKSFPAGSHRFVSSYDKTYRESLSDPSRFWANAANDLVWHKKFSSVYSDNGPNGTWFPDGLANTSYNCLDVHCQTGRADQPALIHDSPVTGRVTQYTYGQLLDEVARFSGVLAELGVTSGDRVVIYMPMIPQTLIAMLACARIGAIHSVVFGGFSSDELAVRIDDARPKLVVSASHGIEGAKRVNYRPLLERAVDLAQHKPQQCVVFQRDDGSQPAAEPRSSRELDWAHLMRTATPHEAVPVPSSHPLYILYTSGTTGRPKGVLRDTGGHMVALKWSMHNIFGIKPGDRWWAASDFGWVVGHSYITYAPLLQGATSVLYEGKPVGTPDAGAFWRVIAQHGVNAMFCAPTALRAIKKEDPHGKLLSGYDLSSFRHMFLAGERADPDTVKWAENLLGGKVPVLDHWWQTETGWPVTAYFAGLGLFPVKHGSAGKPSPGYAVQVLDDEGRPCPANTLGNIVVRRPLPPGTLQTLWQDAARLKSSYFDRFPGFYDTSDTGFIDEAGHVFIMTRTEDVIKVAGHRLSTGRVEELIASHPQVAECCVFAANDSIKGQVPVGVVVLKDGPPNATGVADEIVSLVRTHLGPVYSFKTCIVVKRLPKTRSGKILRSTLRKIANGEDFKVPSTIEDPSTIPELAAALLEAGYGRSERETIL